MATIEKLVPKRINLDTAPDAIQRDGNRAFIPGDILDALNMRLYGHGADGVVKSIKGNVLKQYSGLTSGRNTVIGAFIYQKENSVVFFIWNENSNHQVVEYATQTDTFQKLMEGSWLNFSESKKIDQGGFVDNICAFNDRVNRIRKFNILRARTGFYLGDATKKVIFGAAPPLTPPTAVKQVDTSIPINLIIGSNWQFAYNFIYIDNEESVYSPLSKLVRGGLTDATTDYNYSLRKIRVTVSIPDDLIGLIKKVQIAFREGNTGSYFIFETITNPTLNSYSVEFRNNGKRIAVASSLQSKLYDSIPDRTDGFEFMKNRVFLVRNSIGFDVENTFTLSASLGQESASNLIVNNQRLFDNQYLKGNGSYGIGIVFSNDAGRTSFVRGEKYINVPEGTFIKSAASGTIPARIGIDFIDKKFLNWSLSGTPPSWATQYHIVLTKEKNYQYYAQGLGIPFYYLREKIASEADNAYISPGNYFNYKGKSFFAKYNGPNTPSTLYIQIPINFPIVPREGDVVKILNTAWPLSKSYTVQQLIGDWMDLGPLTEAFSDTITEYQLFFELYRPSTNQQEIFYEIGESYPITGGNFTTVTGKLYGETNIVSLRTRTSLNNPQYKFSLMPVLSNFPTGVNVIPQYSSEGDYEMIIESPSGIFRSVQSLVTSNDSQVTLKRVFTLDYTKADSDYGRAHTTDTNEQNENQYTSIGYSDLYIDNSNINGLTSFFAANRYLVPIELGPITALKKAGDVMLSFHKRNVTSLYVGEGLIRQGKDFILAKTESVIGDDRELRGNYGCINPESIIEVDSEVFFWDGNRGAIIQRTNAGLFPISEYGISNFMMDKSRKLKPYQSSVKVYSGFDYRYGELLFTFSDAINNAQTVIVPAQTWSFNLRRREWITRYSFIPEWYVSMETDLFTFKAAQLWQHDANVLHNNFYGVQYKRFYDIVHNQQIGKNKKYLNIHLKGRFGVNMESDTFIPVRLFTKEGQESFIPGGYFELDEGKYVGPVLRDINTQVQDTQLALLSGDEMVSTYAVIRVENDRTDEAPNPEINVVYKTEEFSI